jgi:hypothetical protein
MTTPPASCVAYHAYRDICGDILTSRVDSLTDRNVSTLIYACSGACS